MPLIAPYKPSGSSVFEFFSFLTLDAPLSYSELLIRLMSWCCTGDVSSCADQNFRMVFPFLRFSPMTLLSLLLALFRRRFPIGVLIQKLFSPHSVMAPKGIDTLSSVFAMYYAKIPLVLLCFFSCPSILVFPMSPRFKQVFRLFSCHFFFSFASGNKGPPKCIVVE